jgi:hypothetical protein
MTNVNLSRLRDRIQPDVRVRLDTEFRLDEFNQSPGRRQQPARTAGKRRRNINYSYMIGYLS